MLELRVSPGRAADVISALRTVALPAKWGPGWLRTQVFRAVDEPGTLVYVEEWRTVETAAREVASARFSRLLALMEAAAEPPNLQFRFFTEVRGLDYVAEVRRAADPTAV